MVTKRTTQELTCGLGLAEIKDEKFKEGERISKSHRNMIHCGLCYATEHIFAMFLEASGYIDNIRNSGEL